MEVLENQNNTELQEKEIAAISFEKKTLFPPLEEDVEKWPIYLLTKDRNAYLDELESFTYQLFKDRSDKMLFEILEKTIFQEKLRMKEDPWRIDPPNDRLFWRKVQNRLYSEENPETPADKENIDHALRMVIKRYAEEIVGTFNPATFRLIRRILTVLFRRLLSKGFTWGRKSALLERLRIYGPIEQIRRLSEKGTIVFLPTHSSNLDSVLVGYAADNKLGIPGVAYGAGLNLYNFGPAAYFMNRLGAYRVDRRKKSIIYLSTLNSMSKLAIQKGTDSLFFPGGTRSRSGHLEKKLKLGLMSTIIEAQRSIYEEGRAQKVFVVPIVVSYHFILEGRNLIEEYLKKTGKEKYTKSRNDLTSVRSWVRFLYQFISESSEIVLSYGKPIDVLGNFVDDEGQSRDERSNIIDVKNYFMVAGELVANAQRESEYTKILGKKVEERYLVENIVLSSHFAAYTAFKILQKSQGSLDIFGLLRLSEDEFQFEWSGFLLQAEQVKKTLIQYAMDEKLKLPEIFLQPIDHIVKDGINRIGTYHPNRPLAINKNGNIYSQNFRLLYFYHNRIDSYPIEPDIDWNIKNIIIHTE